MFSSKAPNSERRQLQGFSKTTHYYVEMMTHDNFRNIDFNCLEFTMLFIFRRKWMAVQTRLGVFSPGRYSKCTRTDSVAKMYNPNQVSPGR